MSDTETFRDRTDWGSGPWDGEPDRVEWYDEDLPCLILRGPGGAICGYVAVPPSHPWHGIGYMDCTQGHGDDCWEHSPDVDVHGGLTFANLCQPHAEGEGHKAICHVPRPGEPDNVWWLGFDCAHHMDIAPGHDASGRRIGLKPVHESVPGHGATYRTVAYVRSEVARLAEQIRAAA